MRQSLISARNRKTGLARDEVITAVFALRNWAAQLQQEIVKPINWTPAESAAALSDVNLLQAKLEKWLETK